MLARLLRRFVTEPALCPLGCYFFPIDLLHALAACILTGGFECRLPVFGVLFPDNLWKALIWPAKYCDADDSCSQILVKEARGITFQQKVIETETFAVTCTK
jgi:hypothetical protein